jgi:hypothetical protein
MIDYGWVFILGAVIGALLGWGLAPRAKVIVRNQSEPSISDFKRMIFLEETKLDIVYNRESEVWVCPNGKDEILFEKSLRTLIDKAMGLKNG